MPAKKLITALDACWFCGGSLKKTGVPPAPECIVGICIRCGHVVAASLAKSGPGIEVQNVTHKWLHESFDAEMLARIRSDQEGVHFRNQHWG